jgi:hypothetical protein
MLAAMSAAIVVAVLCYRIYPGTLPDEKNPSFLSALFNNGIVMFSARLAAVALAFFVVASVVQRVRSREYLGEGFGVKTGPLAQRDELAERLAQRDLELEQMAHERDDALARIPPTGGGLT